MSAAFNTATLSWEVNSKVNLSEVRREIQDAVAVGQYSVAVTMDDGSVLTQTINFQHLMSLDYVPTATYQIQQDASGHIYWTWDTPDNLFTLSQNADISIRAGVTSYKNGKMTKLYWPTISLEMGHCFVPSSIYQDLISDADKVYFGIQVRTNDGQSRASSTGIDITDFSSPVSVTPTSSGTAPGTPDIIEIQQDLSFSLPNCRLTTPSGLISLEADFIYLGEQNGNFGAWF